MSDLRKTYGTAQVCLNGHIVHDAVDRETGSEDPFCHRCGEPTITCCVECNASIRGKLYVERVNDYLLRSVVSKYPPRSAPAYCHACGKPMPWTERRIQAAIELAAELLNSPDKEQFETDLKLAASESHRAQAAGIRLKKLFGKAAGKAGEMLQQVVMDVLSDVAKKAMGLEKP